MKVSHCFLLRNFFAWILSGFLIFAWNQPARAQVNNWLSASSGDWESPQWSFGLPGFNEAIFITNAGVKTIVIEQMTTEYHPSILNIEALTLSAPAGSSNTLFFNFAGVQSPLTMANLTVGPNSTVLMDGSALAATNSFFLDGVFTQDASSVVAAGNITLGDKDSATYLLDSGILTANRIGVGQTFPSLFVQTAGTNACQGMGIYASSEYDLKGGEVGSVSLVYAGGTFKMEGGVCNHSPVGLDGNLLQSGGILRSDTEMTLPIWAPGGHQPGATGRALQTGGTNNQNMLTLGVFSGIVGEPGELNTDGGVYTLSNGWLNAGTVQFYSQGSFVQYGGVATIGQLNPEGALAIGGPYQIGNMIEGIAPGSYALAGGFLSVSNVSIGLAGQITQSGGTNIVSNALEFANTPYGTNGGLSGNYNLTGGLLSVSNFVGTAGSQFTMSGGRLIAQNIISGNVSQSGGTNHVINFSGSYSLSGGVLITTNVQLTNGAFFQHSGGTLSIPSIRLDNGTWQELTNGASLGPLQLGSGTNSIIQFSTNAAFLQFADSSSLNWSNTGVLTIVNWNGSLNGSGTNVIQFGSDGSGLTTQQLGQIQFANPAGNPPGNYLAKILSSGEIVPADRSYLESPPAPFFTGEASLGNDWYYLTGSNQVFGYYDLVNFPYVYHLEMGWEYFTDAANGLQGGYFYDFNDGVWFYTQPSLFPYLYDFGANAWQYYEPQTGAPGHYTSNPRWFYNFSTKTWGNHL